MITEFSASVIGHERIDIEMPPDQNLEFTRSSWHPPDMMRPSDIQGNMNWLGERLLHGGMMLRWQDDEIARDVFYEAVKSSHPLHEHSFSTFLETKGTISKLHTPEERAKSESTREDARLMMKYGAECIRLGQKVAQFITRPTTKHAALLPDSWENVYHHFSDRLETPESLSLLSEPIKPTQTLSVLFPIHVKRPREALADSWPSKTGYRLLMQTQGPDDELQETASVEVECAYDTKVRQTSIVTRVAVRGMTTAYTQGPTGQPFPERQTASLSVIPKMSRTLGRFINEYNRQHPTTEGELS